MFESNEKPREEYNRRIAEYEECLKRKGLDRHDQLNELDKFRLIHPGEEIYDIELFKSLGAYKCAGYALMKNLPLFHGVGDDFLRKLSKSMEFVEVGDGGATIYKAGDTVDAIYFVQEGLLEIASGADPMRIGAGDVSRQGAAYMFKVSLVASSRAFVTNTFSFT